MRAAIVLAFCLLLLLQFLSHPCLSHPSAAESESAAAATNSNDVNPNAMEMELEKDGAETATPRTGSLSPEELLADIDRHEREQASRKQRLESQAAKTAEKLSQSTGEYDVRQFMPFTWAAPFLSGGGYCSEAISFALSLSPFFGSKFSVQQHGDSFNPRFVHGLDKQTQETLHHLFGHPQQFELTKGQREKLAKQNAALGFEVPAGGIAICHSEPGAWHMNDEFPARYSTSHCPHPNAKIKIGRTMFETDRLPSGWEKRLNLMYYVWVPTEFHRRVFAKGGVDKHRLVVVPEPVDTEFYSPAHAKQVPAFRYDDDENGLQRMENGVKQNKPHRFLSIFKWEERKGWQILLESYLREFATNEPAKRPNVVLYILTAAYHSESDFQIKIDEFVETLTWQQGKPAHLPVVHLLKTGLSEDQLVSVYASVDTFVLPSRGEGWGRPHVEAMSMGLPVIATHWSGPSEYMHHGNSYPLNHDGLVEIKEGAFKGHKWAQPSGTQLQQLMREVYTNPDAARAKGKLAREDMVNKYCQACVAKLVIKEMARIQKIRSNHEEDLPVEKDEL